MSEFSGSNFRYALKVSRVSVQVSVIKDFHPQFNSLPSFGAHELTSQNYLFLGRNGKVVPVDDFIIRLVAQDLLNPV